MATIERIKAEKEGSSLKRPEHVRVYELLRDMILYGELAPGEAVTIQGLVNVLGAGMTPVREAIRRLTTEGALETLGNRRVCVPELNADTLDELAFARLALEPKLAFWATQAFSAAKISELDVVDKALNSAIRTGNVREYLIQNHRFHMEIYAAAGKPELLSIVVRLWLRTGPSSRMVIGRMGTKLSWPDMHVEILNGIRAGDPEAVERAMRADILQGIDGIRDCLHENDKEQ